MMMKILGYDVESVSMAADDVRKVGYLNVNHFYPKSDKRPPVCVSHERRPSGCLYFQGHGRTGRNLGRDAARGGQRRAILGTLLDIQKSFEKRSLYQPLDVIRKKFQRVQAAYYSQFERSSAPVKIASVPADWPIPAWTPGWYDGSEFRK